MTTRGNIRQQNAERRLSHARWEVKRRTSPFHYVVGLLVALVAIGLAR